MAELVHKGTFRELKQQKGNWCLSPVDRDQLEAPSNRIKDWHWP